MAVVCSKGSDILCKEWLAENVAKFGEPEVCDGKIACSIMAVDTPDYCSSHYAELEITFTCSKDKSSHSHWLAEPLTVEEIQRIVEGHIVVMTDEDHRKRCRARVRADRARHKETERILAIMAR